MKGKWEGSGKAGKGEEKCERVKVKRGGKVNGKYRREETREGVYKIEGEAEEGDSNRTKTRLNLKLLGKKYLIHISCFH